MTRFLNKTDIPLILALYQSDFLDGWSKSQLESAFDTQRFIAVGEFNKDLLIGVATVSVGYDDVDLEGIVVKENFRKRGVATKLLGVLFDKVKDLGKDKIFLEVRESNIVALNFYVKCGFEKISVRKNYYPNGENATVMVKEI